MLVPKLSRKNNLNLVRSRHNREEQDFSDLLKVLLGTK